MSPSSSCTAPGASVSSSSASLTISSTATGSSVTPSTPACSRLTSSRSVTRLREVAEALVGRFEQLGAVRLRQPDLARAQRGDGRRRRGERTAQVVSDSGEQGAAQPIRRGERAHPLCLGREPAALESRLELRDESAEDLAIGGVERLARAESSSRSSPRGSARVLVVGRRGGLVGRRDRRRPRPRARVTLRHAERLAQPADERLDRVRAADDAARHRDEHLGFRGRAIGDPQAPRRLVDHDADQRADDEEDDQRHEVRRLGDSDDVQRRDRRRSRGRSPRRRAARSAGQMPPTSATTTTNSWKASTSAVSALRASRRALSGQVMRGRPTTRQHDTGDPATQRECAAQRSAVAVCRPARARRCARRCRRQAG